MKQSKKIFICILDWGLGHATRCSQLVDEFLIDGHEVFLLGGGKSGQWLQKKYPSLPFLPLSNPEVDYSRSKSMFWNIALQFPKILNGLHKEKRELAQLVKKHNPDVIVSDSRFGCYSKRAKSIMLIHQLVLKCPPSLSWLEPITYWGIKFKLRNFDEIWVPDFEQTPRLADELSSKPAHRNRKFIGPLSRLKPLPEVKEENLILALVSGPEPARTTFEKYLKENLPKLDTPFVLLTGQPNQSIGESLKNGKVYSHLPDSELNLLFQKAKIIISRSGYSTIMDLAKMNKKAVLFPTPKQTEQEFLADYGAQNNWFEILHEGEPELSVAIEKAAKKSFPKFSNQNKNLRKLL